MAIRRYFETYLNKAIFYLILFDTDIKNNNKNSWQSIVNKQMTMSTAICDLIP